MSPATDLECGQQVLELDGQAAVAYCGPRPPHRDITAGSTGPDADELWSYLQEIGLLADPEKAVMRRQAITSFRSTYGLGKGPYIKVGDLVWISTARQPSTVALQPGQQVATGDEIFTSTGAVIAAAIRDFAPATDAGSTWVVEVPGISAPLTVATDGTVDPTALSSVAIETARNEQSPEQTVVDTTVRLATPLNGWAVPASAVIQDGPGTCVLVRLAAESQRPVPVEVVGYSVGSALVQGALEAQDVVVTRTEPEDARC